MTALDDLLRQVEASPHDWELRVLAVEHLAAAGQTGQARALVRSSPNIPVPYTIQKRLWNALSGDAPIQVIEAPDGGKPELRAKARMSAKAGSPPSRPAPKPSAGATLSPRSGKPVLRSALRQARRDLDFAPSLKVADLPPIAQVKTRTRDLVSRFTSSFSTALLVHLALVLIASVIVLRMPSMSVPQLIAIAVPESPLQDDLPLRSISRPVEISSPAAASMSLANLITVESMSAFQAPRFDQMSPSLDLNLIDTSLGMSQGASFEGEGQESMVSFFGIKGGGRRIAILVDATPYMLLDEKGGMVAYDKVKQEIASMLGLLNPGTSFNIIVFQGKRLSMYQEQPVRALPSAVNRAIAWLDPLNRDYEALGLRDNFTDQGIRDGLKPIVARDIAHYSKAIQAALEQNVNAIFCITAGWRGMDRSLSPEDQMRLNEALAKRNAEMRDVKVEYDPREVEAWNKAQEKAREWLRKENEARREKGLPPKVVIDFGQLIQQVSPGARPPQPRRSQDPPPLDIDLPDTPPYTPEDVEKHVEVAVNAYFGKNKPDRPALHMVLFLGDEEDIGEYEEHFKRLSRRNQGELKILRGLAALQNVTKVGE